ncbi:MAG: hypothetical protein KAG34_04345 [Cocleimonas sp.]|nr:hypothetical protein [Cocleimonas sp.]
MTAALLSMVGPFSIDRNVLLTPRFMALILTITLSFAGFFIYVVGAPTLVFDIL